MSAATDPGRSAAWSNLTPLPWDDTRDALHLRTQIVGKASPVRSFWGGADLCTTRLSGRRAPKHPGGAPDCPDWVQEMALDVSPSLARP